MPIIPTLSRLRQGTAETWRPMWAQSETLPLQKNKNKIRKGKKIAKDISAENEHIRCSTLIKRQIQIKFMMAHYISTRIAESKG